MLRTRQGPRTDRLAIVCAHRGVPLALAVAIAVTDHVVHQQQARRQHQVSGSARAGMVAGIAAGAAWGVAAHFLRDVATAPIALWWPVSGAGMHIPGYWYLAALLVLATLPPPCTQP